MHFNRLRCLTLLAALAAVFAALSCGAFNHIKFVTPSPTEAPAWLGEVLPPAREPAKTVPALGFQIKDGLVFDATGKEFLMRGINYPHNWYASRLKESLHAIAAAGANTVRVVLSCGKLWKANPAADVRQVISQAKNNRLIAVLEVHDTTGYGENAGTASLAEATDYWISLKDVLKGQEAFVIINLGNEPFGNQNLRSGDAWVKANLAALGRLRAAGLKNVIMLDAPNWGQDHEHFMYDRAGEILKQDSQVIFSVHMYQVYGDEGVIRNYLNQFREKHWPLVVGEFGNEHYGEDVDEASILRICHEYGIGWMAWSWCGNSSEVANLDLIADWDTKRLSPWGDFIINSPGGLLATARAALVYPPYPEEE